MLINMPIVMCCDECYEHEHKEQDAVRLHFSPGLKDNE